MRVQANCLGLLEGVVDLGCEATRRLSVRPFQEILMHLLDKKEAGSERKRNKIREGKRDARREVFYFEREKKMRERERKGEKERGWREGGKERETSKQGERDRHKGKLVSALVATDKSASFLPQGESTKILRSTRCMNVGSTLDSHRRGTYLPLRGVRCILSVKL